jgi:hypothetical protein
MGSLAWIAATNTPVTDVSCQKIHHVCLIAARMLLTINAFNAVRKPALKVSLCHGLAFRESTELIARINYNYERDPNQKDSRSHHRRNLSA